MSTVLNISKKTIYHPEMPDDMELAYQYETAISNALQFEIRRYKKSTGPGMEDWGIIAYNYIGKKSKENYLELIFCIDCSRYGTKKECVGNSCSNPSSLKNADLSEAIDVFRFRFLPAYFQPFQKQKISDRQIDQILAFQYKQSVSHTFPICSKNRSTLENILHHQYTGGLADLFINAQVQTLLSYSLDNAFNEKQETFSCKFLANDEDRKKILRAREILLQRIGEPITIKELARSVATNECYLKKGFKEMFGTTIFDFYQARRMEHAKYLLYEKGLTVTDVSLLLGYSSISHFSTAFKKQTGLKPCELLFK